MRNEIKMPRAKTKREEEPHSIPDPDRAFENDDKSVQDRNKSVFNGLRKRLQFSACIARGELQDCGIF